MTPTPGSPEAREAGCTCPVMDNRHGRGYYVTKDGNQVFVIQDDCPLHGTGILKTLVDAVSEKA